MADKNDESGSKLREQLEAALAENATLKRERVVDKSGIDTENPMAKFFVEKYDGEWTPEAFTEKAKEYGLIPEQSDEDGEEEPKGDDSDKGDKDLLAAQMDAVFNATASGSNNVPKSDPKWKKASTPEEFMELYDGRTV